MAAVAAVAAGRRQRTAAVAWRAGLCAMQQLCLQPAGLASTRSISAGPWQPQQLPYTLPERQQGPAAGMWPPQRDAAVPWSLRQLLAPPQHSWPVGDRCMSSTPRSSSSSGSSPAGSIGSSRQPSPEQQQRQKAAAAAAFQAAGWSRQEVVNVPNALSLARLLSGPLIASWILDGQASSYCCC